MQAGQSGIIITLILPCTRSRHPDQAQRNMTQVESVLTRDGLYANTAWNSVRRDYGRFAYDISRDLASSAAAHSGKASTPGAGAATPPTRATPHGAGAGWGRFRYVNPYWWLGYDKPPQWMSGARNEEGMGICRDVQEQRGGGGESGTWGVVQEQRVGGGESGTQGEGGEGEGLAASKKTGVAGSEHATASKGERGEAGGRGDGGVGAEGGGMQTSKKKKAFVA